MANGPVRLEFWTAYLIFYFAFRALVQLTMFPGAPTEMLPVLFLGLILNVGAVTAVLKSKAYWPLVALCWVHFGVGITYSWVDALMSLMAVVSIHSSRSHFRPSARLAPSSRRGASARPSSPASPSSEEKRAA